MHTEQCVKFAPRIGYYSGDKIKYDKWDMQYSMVKEKSVKNFVENF